VPARPAPTAYERHAPDPRLVEQALAPSRQGRLELLARDRVSGTSAMSSGPLSALATPERPLWLTGFPGAWVASNFYGPLDVTPPEADLYDFLIEGSVLFGHGAYRATLLHAPGSEPIRLYAVRGDILASTGRQVVRYEGSVAAENFYIAGKPVQMRAGRDMVEQAIGRSVAGFIAPAWLYGPGAHAALKACDFALAEDHFRVWQPRTVEIVARGPVVTWASRSPARTASSLAVAAVARTMPDWMPTMRVAVHPGDVTKESLLTSIDRTLRTLAERRTVSRYADLVAEQVPLAVAA